MNDKQKGVFLGERCFYLNSRKSKFVSICLSVDFEFAPCVIISGGKINSTVVLTQQEWNDIIANKELINSFICKANSINSIDIGRLAVEFVQLPQCIRIYSGDAGIRLSTNSLSKLWQISPLIQFRLNVLKDLEFPLVMSLLKGAEEDMSLGILETVKYLNPEIYTLGLEVIYYYPELLKKSNPLDESAEKPWE